MALIRCPECGGEVSSAAGACIHCGYQFVVCPECGEVLPKNAQICTKCGYRFSPQQAKETQKDPDFNQMSNRVNADNILQKKLSATASVFSIFGMILMLIAFLFIILWGKADFTDPLLGSVEKLLKLEKTRNICRVLVIIAVLFDFAWLTGCVFFANGFVAWRCANWIKQNKIQYKEYLVSARDSISDMKSERNYKRVKKSAFYADMPKDKNFYIAKTVLTMLCFIAFEVFITMFIFDAIDKIINMFLVGSGFEYSSLLKSLIPCAYCLVPIAVIEIIFTVIEKRDERLWAQKQNLS